MTREITVANKGIKCNGNYINLRNYLICIKLAMLTIVHLLRTLLLSKIIKSYKHNGHKAFKAYFLKDIFCQLFADCKRWDEMP